MAGEAKKLQQANRWLIGTGWMAGIVIVLVEMQMGVDYVQASVMEHAKMIAGWLPMIGTLVSQIIVPFAAHSQGEGSPARLLAAAAIPAGLAAAGWALKVRATE